MLGAAPRPSCSCPPFSFRREGGLLRSLSTVYFFGSSCFGLAILRLLWSLERHAPAWLNAEINEKASAIPSVISLLRLSSIFIAPPTVRHCGAALEASDAGPCCNEFFDLASSGHRIVMSWHILGPLVAAALKWVLGALAFVWCGRICLDSVFGRALLCGC